jgi:hypothetical protein
LEKMSLMKTAVEILEEIKLLPILERLALSKLLNDMLIEYIINISIEKKEETNVIDLFKSRREKPKSEKQNVIF